MDRIWVGPVSWPAASLRNAMVTTLVLAAGPAVAQISPGELASAHASLEGTSGCAKCHDPRKGVAPDRCLTCHTAIKQRIDEGWGLHARPEYRRCETCHIDHQGRNADLRWWGPKGIGAFDHKDAGYALEGKHAPLTCGSCHNPSRVTDPAALTRGGGNAARTYLGLGTACVSCHEDVHLGQFGKRDCLSCHTMDSFKTAPRFDHSQTRYPLAGRHASVPCEKCHARTGPGPKAQQAFAGVAFSSCTSCHLDPHRGRLGGQCASCHVVGGWSTILNTSAFNHSRTSYPLAGRHRAVSCEKCHKGSLTANMRHDRCSDCHVDSHRGEFKARADGGACESCHDLETFAAARFSVDEHQRTAYRLEGAHLAVPCNQCHKTAPKQKTATYRLPHGRCLDCHKDPHNGSMDRWGGTKGCLACHRIDSWKGGSFDHSTTQFPLTLGHARVPCAACHLSLKARSRDSIPSFAGLSVGCDSCHRDPHVGQFAREGRTSCERCHDRLAWTPAPGFDHTRDSIYPLDGVHSKTPCDSCHKVETQGGVTFTRYKPLGLACASCHAGRKT